MARNNHEIPDGDIDWDEMVDELDEYQSELDEANQTGDDG